MATVYINQRSDGLSGSGTASDPYNASTLARYETLLAGFAPGTTVMYAAGTYQTGGWVFTGLQTAAPGVTHMGISPQLCTVQLSGVSSASGRGVIFGCDYNVRADGFSLQNLTLDVNATAQPIWSGGGASLGAVNVQGSNILIKNCHVTNFGTSKSGNECFPVFCYPGSSGFSASAVFNNVRVENCDFFHPATGNLDGLTACAVGCDPGLVLTSASIQGCKFLDLDSDFTYSHAMGAPVCTGNLIKSVATGFYIEPASVMPDYARVVDNTFIDVFQAAAINFHPTGGYGGLLFAQNRVSLRDGGLSVYSVGAVVNSSSGTPTVGSIYVVNNRFMSLCPSGQSPGWRAVDFRPTTMVISALTITGNLLVTKLPNAYELDMTSNTTALPSVTCTNNFYSDGTTASAYRH